MTIPAGFPYPLNQVVEIPLEQIIPNPDQPRRSMRQEPLETLAASMKAKGQLTEAKVRPLTEAERAAYRKIHPAQQMADGKLSDSDHLLDPGPWVMLVGGHRRRLAALKNGFKTLKCTVHDITPEDTHYQALMDNDHEAMDWWDWDIAIEKESKIFQGTQDALAARLDKGITKVKVALRITKTLNPAARALVDENLQKTLKNEGRSPSSKNKAFSITEENLLVLAGLEDPDRVLEALQVVLDDYLTTDQTQRLVEHMQAGEPVGTFSPHKPVPPKPKAVQPASHPDTPPELSNHPTHHPSESHAKVVELPVPAHAHHAHSPAGISVPSGPQPADISHSGGAASTSAEPEDNWFWKMMVGIKFFNQLRSKVKKGEPLTGWEKCFVWAHAGLKALGEFLKILRKIFGPIVKTIGHAAKKALGDTFYGLLVLLFRIALICLLVWAVIKVIDYGFVYPWHWVEKKAAWVLDGGLWSPKSVTPVPTPVSTPLPVATQAEKVRSSELGSSQLKPKTSNSSLRTSNSTPIASYQPAVSFNTASSPSAPARTLYDPKILDFEIQSLPKNCVVRDYPMTPDEGMPVDVAVSRMQDLIDPDKYTLMIGGSKQIMTSVNPTSTTLTIDYKGADLFNVLGGGSGPIHFLWEDVLYIHANEIDVETNTPSVIYQCSLVVSGSKIPLTLQCATAADLEHLVSTMQYFIRNSRLGRDTALGGMPYPNQGFVFNGDLVVKKLWANSPAGHAVSSIETAQPNRVAQLGASQQVAGLALGDHLWSVGKAASDQQEKKVLEAGLQSLPATLFAVSDTDWVKAVIARNSNMTPYFHPKLRQVLLGTL